MTIARMEDEMSKTTGERLPNGRAMAAILAAGLGCFALGLMTTGAEISANLKTTLNLYNPVGPLSGKTTIAVLVYFVSWIALYFLWRDRDVNAERVIRWTGVLIALGFLLTFPPFFALFGP